MGSSKDYHFYLLALGSKLEIAPSFLDDEQMRRQLVCTAAVDQLCDGIISASLRTGYKTITASYGTGNEIVVPAVYRIVGTFDARKWYESWTPCRLAAQARMQKNGKGHRSTKLMLKNMVR